MIIKDLDYYMSLPYSIIVDETAEEDGGGYFAFFEELPGIMGDGETAAEAIRDAREAFKTYVKLEMKERKPIPEPKTEPAKERVQATIHKPVLLLIDRFIAGLSETGGKKVTRSEFLERAALHEMERVAKKDALQV